MTVKIILTCCALLFITAVCCGETTLGAKIEFQSTTHDFGVIHERGGTVYCEMKFKNVGDKPLVILNAKAECGCTGVQYPKQPIMPGDTGVIKIGYNPFGRPGAFKKDVKVQTNSKKKKDIVLSIIGNTIPAGKDDI